MKKFTKIMLIIAAVLIGLAVLFYGVAVCIGGGRAALLGEVTKNGGISCGKWHIGTKGIYYGSEWDEDETDEDEWDDVDDWTKVDDMAKLNTAEKIEIPVSDVKKIKMNISAAAVKIVSANDTDRITAELKDGEERYFDCKLEGDTCSIIYDYKKKITLLDDEAKLLISIPNDSAFENITMDIGAADVKMTVSDMSCENMKISVGAGNLQADGFSVSEVLDISIGAGNVEIADGSYQDVKLDCGMGNLEFGGTISGNLDGDCGMGAIELELKGNETDYDYKLVCGMGEIVINDTTYSVVSGSHKITNENAIGTIDLDCGMGEITCEIQ